MPAAGLLRSCPAQSTAWQCPTAQRSWSRRAALTRSSAAWLLLGLLRTPIISAQKGSGPGGGGPDFLRLPDIDYLGNLSSTFFQVAVNTDYWEDGGMSADDEDNPVNLQKGCLNITQAKLDQEEQESGSFSGPPESALNPEVVRVAMTASFTGDLQFPEGESLKNALALTQYMSKYSATGWSKQRPIEFCLVDDQSNFTRAMELYKFWILSEASIDIVLSPSNKEWLLDIARVTDVISMTLLIWAAPRSFYSNTVFGTQPLNTDVLDLMAGYADQAQPNNQRRLLQKKTNSKAGRNLLENEDDGGEGGSTTAEESTGFFSTTREAAGEAMTEVIITTLNSPASVGATQIEVADTTGLSQGMRFEISDGTNSDTGTITEITPNGNRRLLRDGRRLAAGIITIDTPLTNSYAAGASVSATNPQGELPPDDDLDCVADSDDLTTSSGTMTFDHVIYGEGATLNCCTGSQATIAGSSSRTDTVDFSDKCRPFERFSEGSPLFIKITCEASGLIVQRFFLDCKCQHEANSGIDWSKHGACEKTECLPVSRKGPWKTTSCDYGAPHTRYFHDEWCEMRIDAWIHRNGECGGPNLLVNKDEEFETIFSTPQWQGFCDASDSQSQQSFCEQCLSSYPKDQCVLLISVPTIWQSLIASSCHACHDKIFEYCYGIQPKGHHFAVPYDPLFSGTVQILASTEKAGVSCCPMPGEDPSEFCTSPPACQIGCEPKTYLEAMVICASDGMRVCSVIEYTGLLCKRNDAGPACQHSLYWASGNHFLFSSILGLANQVFSSQLVSDSEYCTNGNWKWDLRADQSCIFALAHHASCSGAFYGVPEDREQHCWCVDREDTCADRQTVTPEMRMSTYMVANFATAPTACPSDSDQVSEPLFACEPSYNSGRYSLGQDFRLPKGLKSLYLDLAVSGASSVVLLDEADGSTIIKLDMPQGTINPKDGLEYGGLGTFHLNYKDTRLTILLFQALSAFEIAIPGILTFTMNVQVDVKTSLATDMMLTYFHNGIENCQENATGCQKHWDDKCWLRPPQCVDTFTYNGSKITTGSGCITKSFGLQGWCSHTPVATTGSWSNCTNICVEGYPICPIGFKQTQRIVFPCNSSASKEIWPRQVQVELAGSGSTSVVQIPTDVNDINFTVTTLSPDVDIEVFDATSDQYVYHRTLGIVNKFYGDGDNLATYKGLGLSRRQGTYYKQSTHGYACREGQQIDYSLAVLSTCGGEEEDGEGKMEGGDEGKEKEREFDAKCVSGVAHQCYEACDSDTQCTAVTMSTSEEEPYVCHLSLLCDEPVYLGEYGFVFNKTYSQTVSIGGQVGPDFQLELSLFSQKATVVNVSYVSGHITPCPTGMFGAYVFPGCSWASTTTTTTTTTIDIVFYVQCPQGTRRDTLILVGCLPGPTQHVEQQEIMLVDERAQGTIMEISKGVSDVTLKASSADVKIDLSLLEADAKTVIVGNNNAMSNLQVDGSVMGMNFFYTGGDDTAPYESILRLTGTSTGYMKINLTFGRDGAPDMSDEPGAQFELTWEYALDSCNSIPSGCVPFNASHSQEILSRLGLRIVLNYPSAEDLWETISVYEISRGIPWTSTFAFLTAVLMAGRDLKDEWKLIFAALDLNQDGYWQKEEAENSTLFSSMQEDVDGQFWIQGFRNVVDVNMQMRNWGEDLFKQLYSKGARRAFFIASIDQPPSCTPHPIHTGPYESGSYMECISFYNLCEGNRRIAEGIGFEHTELVSIVTANISLTAAALSRDPRKIEDVFVVCGSIEVSSTWLTLRRSLDLESNAFVFMYPYSNRVTRIFESHLLRDILEPVPWKLQMLDNAFGSWSSEDLLTYYYLAFDEVLTLSAAQVLTASSLLFLVSPLVRSVERFWRKDIPLALKNGTFPTLLGKVAFDGKGKRNILETANTETRQFTPYPKDPQNTQEKLIRYYTSALELVGDRSSEDWATLTLFARLVSLISAPQRRLQDTATPAPGSFQLPIYKELVYPHRSNTANFREVYVCKPGCSFDRERCIPCPPGTFRSVYEITCEPCTNQGDESNEIKYSDRWGAPTCKLCPDGAVCENSVEVPEAAPGMFRLDRAMVEKGKPEHGSMESLLDSTFLDPGQDGISWNFSLSQEAIQTICEEDVDYERYLWLPCTPQDICLGGNVCQETNTGLFCSSCIEKYSSWGFYKSMFRCKKCSSDEERVAWILVFCVLYAAGVYALSILVKHQAIKKESIAIGVLRILMTHLHMLVTVMHTSEFDTVLSLYNYFPGSLADLCVIPWLTVQLDCLWSKSERLNMYKFLLITSLLWLPMVTFGIISISLVKIFFREMRFRRKYNASKEMLALKRILHDRMKDLKEANNAVEEFRTLEAEMKKKKKKDQDQDVQTILTSISSRASISRAHSRLSTASSGSSVADAKQFQDLKVAKAEIEEGLRMAVVDHQHALEAVMKASVAEHQTHNALRKALNRSHEVEGLAAVRRIVSWLFLAYAPVLSVSARLMSCATHLDRPRLRMDLEIECDSAAYTTIIQAAFANFVIVGASVPLLLFAVMMCCVRHYGSLDDLQLRQTLGLLFVGFKPNCWIFGILNFVKIGAIVSITALDSSSNRLMASIALLLFLVALNHLAEQNETFDRESLGYLELCSCAALLLTEFAGFVFNLADYYGGEESMATIERLTHWRSEVASGVSLLHIAVLLYGMFGIVYNAYAVKLVIARSAGAQLAWHQRTLLHVLRSQYGLRELTLHTDEDEVVIIYNMRHDTDKHFSKHILEKLRRVGRLSIGDLNTMGAFDLEPRNVCAVISMDAFECGEFMDAIEQAIMLNRNIVFVRGKDDGIDIELEVFRAAMDKVRRSTHSGLLSRERLTHQLHKVVEQKKVVDWDNEDVQGSVKRLKAMLDLKRPTGEMSDSQDTIDMSDLQDNERQIVHNSMEEIVRACMDCSANFSPSLCARSFVLAFQRALSLRGLQITIWNDKQRLNLGSGTIGKPKEGLNNKGATKSITVDEFYNAVKDVNDDLIEQHPDIVRRIVQPEGVEDENEDEELFGFRRKVKELHKASLETVSAVVQKGSETVQMGADFAGNEVNVIADKTTQTVSYVIGDDGDPQVLPEGHMRKLSVEKWRNFTNARYEQDREPKGPGYHCPRCRKSYSTEDAQAQGLMCSCPDERLKTEENPCGENMIGNEKILTPLKEGGLWLQVQNRKNEDPWMQKAPDALEVEQDARYEMSKFDRTSKSFMRRQWLQQKVAKAEAEVKLLEQRLDNQLRRKARMDQASAQATGTDANGNKQELELERLLGRSGPMIAVDKATLFSSWAEDGSTGPPSTLLSPRARGLFGSGSAEEKQVPLSFWEHLDGFASEFKAAFTSRPALAASATPEQPHAVVPDASQSLQEKNIAENWQALNREHAGVPSSGPTNGIGQQQLANGHAGVFSGLLGSGAASSSGLATESRPKAQAKSRVDARPSLTSKTDAEDTAPEDVVARQPAADARPLTNSALSSSMLSDGPRRLELRFQGDRKKVNAGVFRTMLYAELRKLGVTSQTLDSITFSLLPDDVLTVQIGGATSVISDLSALSLSNLNVVGCRVIEVKEE